MTYVDSSQSTSTTTLQTETQLSLLYRVLSTVIKPFKPHLVKPGKPLPGGSPRLTSHPKSKNKCTIIERQHKATDLWLYDFVPQQATTTTPTHQILYFAGGGFQSPPSSEHWSFVSTLASQLPSQYKFTIVSYPLAPNSPASVSLPILQKYLRYEIADATQEGRKISLMGDSAGGNVVLSLGFWWIETLGSNGSAGMGSSSNKNDAFASSTTTTTTQSSSKSSSPVLQNLIVISPACDHRNTNPQIHTTDSLDPVLGKDLIESVSAAWTSAPPSPSSSSSSSDPAALPPSSSRSDPNLSPLLHHPSTFRQFKQQNVRIHGIFGTHDVLAPDAELFRRKCVEFEVPGDWMVWEGQMHCFPLAGVYGMMEGRRGVEWVREVLERNV